MNGCMDGRVGGYKSYFGGLIPIFRNNIFQKVDYFIFFPLYFSYTIGLNSIPLLKALVEQGLFSFLSSPM